MHPYYAGNYAGILYAGLALLYQCFGVWRLWVNSGRMDSESWEQQFDASPGLESWEQPFHVSPCGSACTIGFGETRVDFPLGVAIEVSRLAACF